MNETRLHLALLLSLLIATSCYGAEKSVFRPRKNFPKCDFLYHQIENSPGSWDKYATGDISAVFVREEEGQHGGKRIRVKKTGDKWYSFGGSFEDAPQGDPRWMIKILGEETARFLGYEIISENEMILPLASELNLAIAKINASSDRKLITSGFYMGSDIRSPREEYFGNFVEKGCLPISPEGTTTIHDLSYHTSIIFYPEPILDLARRQTQLILELQNHLKKAELSPTDRENAEAVLDKLFTKKALDLDAGTGNLMSALARITAMPYQHYDFDYITSGGASPIRNIKDVAAYRNAENTLVLPNKAVQKQIDRFLATRKNDKRFSEGAGDCDDTHCGTILHNIGLIQMSVKKIKLQKELKNQ